MKSMFSTDCFILQVYLGEAYVAGTSQQGKALSMMTIWIWESASYAITTYSTQPHYKSRNNFYLRDLPPPLRPCINERSLILDRQTNSLDSAQTSKCFSDFI